MPEPPLTAARLRALTCRVDAISEVRFEILGDSGPATAGVVTYSTFQPRDANGTPQGAPVLTITLKPKGGAT